MLLDKYKDAGLLFNVNFLENASSASLSAFRGEWVLVEGGVGDAKGHSKPPKEIVRGVILLADEKLKLLVGAIDRMAQIHTLLEKYQADFAADMQVLLYVVNIEKAAQVEIAGINFILIPLLQGVPWNEVLDELALEKSDFKGMSAADKIVKVYEEMQAYKPKYPTLSLEEVLASATNAVRETVGAV